MKRALFVCMLVLVGCTKPEKTRTLLEAQGLSDVKITGYRFFGCDSGKGSDDNWHTGFEATGPTGKRVTGVVCEGLLKGATVRYD